MHAAFCMRTYVSEKAQTLPVALSDEDSCFFLVMNLANDYFLEQNIPVRSLPH